MIKTIDTIELFPIINNRLIELLKSTSIEEFDKPTQFDTWKVKDICAHLLDTSLRRLSEGRDNYQSLENVKIETYSDLVNYVTKIADRWAIAFHYISPKILIDLIEEYQNELYYYFKDLNPLSQSLNPVSWAGENKSQNWFDIAREYTERWHHQMQIREALKRDVLYEKELYYPVLDTFMRALPFHYRKWKMEHGYTLCVNIDGNAGGKWYLKWNDKIELVKEVEDKSQTQIDIKQDDAWKIFTRWKDKNVYRASIKGNNELGEHILEMNCLIIKQ